MRAAVEGQVVRRLRRAVPRHRPRRVRRGAPPRARPSSSAWPCPRPARPWSATACAARCASTTRQIDDQILLKSDGFPTYHLANVVDDHLMGITHVIRAEEWLSSTPKHVVLYQAFGWQAPEWIHMPLLRNADKSKISKRKNPVSLDYYRAAGFLPEALLNYLGTMGWSISGDREKFTLAEMIEAFTFDRMSLGGPVFDLVKLSAMNADYLRALDDDGIVARLRDWRLGDDYLRAARAAGAPAHPAPGRVRAHDRVLLRGRSRLRARWPRISSPRTAPPRTWPTACSASSRRSTCSATSRTRRWRPPRAPSPRRSPGTPRSCSWSCAWPPPPARPPRRSSRPWPCSAAT